MPECSVLLCYPGERVSMNGIEKIGEDEYDDTDDDEAMCVDVMMPSLPPSQSQTQF